MPTCIVVLSVCMDAACQPPLKYHLLQVNPSIPTLKPQGKSSLDSDFQYEYRP